MFTSLYIEIQILPRAWCLKLSYTIAIALNVSIHLGVDHGYMLTSPCSGESGIGMWKYGD